MVTAEQNSILTRTGAGTPMGETMRRYWLPALFSFEVPEPDCPPVRVQLLGEKLVAFRDTNGRIGLLEEFCAHRCASLWLGRNEEGGLRCVYHGWKYDADGQCVNMMNEPEDFSSKVKLKAYPTLEEGGIVWAYMGPADKKPAAPKFELTQVADTHRYVTKVWQECNWLQGLEGGIDTSHAPILHRRLNIGAGMAGIGFDSPFVQGKAPTLKVENTDYGYRYYGIRPLEDNTNYVRGYHYVTPFTQIRPGDSSKSMSDGHFWVPIDDHNVMVWNWYYTFGEEALGPAETTERGHGNAFGTDIDIENEFRSKQHKRNDYMIDRQAQKEETFTGIRGVNTQDRAVQESMGPIVDRSKEFLGPADMAIVAMRRLLLEAVRTAEDGGDPPGVAPTYYHLRGADGVIPGDVDWQKVLLAKMYPDTPPGSSG